MWRATQVWRDIDYGKARVTPARNHHTIGVAFVRVVGALAYRPR